MAVKEKVEESKTGRLVEYLKNEHVWENYVLLILAILTLLLGVLINNGVLTVNYDAWLIGPYSEVLAWVLIVVSSFSIILALYPFFKPAFPDFKKISWLKRKMFVANSTRVFMFIITLSLIFLLFDAFLAEIIAIFLS